VTSQSAPNKRVQRTRSSPSALRSPLTRRPLGRAMQHRAARLATVALGGLFAVGLGGIPQSAEKWAGIVVVSFKYKPVEVRSLDDLPPHIVAALTAHLQERLGADFLSQLRFSGGQAVDVERLYREDPSAKKLRWQVFSYRLIYSLSLPEKGIRVYEAAIWLDRNGKVIREIDLPAVAKDPSKGTFVSLGRALEVAAAHGFEPARAELEYRPKEDIITYRLSRVDAKFRFYFFDVDAHSGDFVEEWSVQGDP
jgi:hypothetical protein